MLRVFYLVSAEVVAQVHARLARVDVLALAEGVLAQLVRQVDENLLAQVGVNLDIQITTSSSTLDVRIDNWARVS